MGWQSLHDIWLILQWLPSLYLTVYKMANNVYLYMFDRFFYCDIQWLYVSLWCNQNVDLSHLEFSCDLLLRLLFYNHLIYDLSCYSIQNLLGSNHLGLSGEVFLFLLDWVFIFLRKKSDFYISIFLIPPLIAESLILANHRLFEPNLHKLLVACQLSI